jgi:hypothetical protein
VPDALRIVDLAIAARYTEQGHPHWALGDSGVLLVEGDKVTVL